MKTFNFKLFFSPIGQKTDCRRAGKNEEKSKTTRKRLENDSKTIGYVTRTWRESGARVAKYAAMLIAVLILGIGQVWGAASTSSDGKYVTSVVDMSGMGSLSATTNYWYNGVKIYSGISNSVKANTSAWSEAVSIPTCVTNAKAGKNAGKTTNKWGSSGSDGYGVQYTMSGFACNQHTIGIHVNQACTVVVVVDKNIGSYTDDASMTASVDATAYGTGWTSSNYKTAGTALTVTSSRAAAASAPGRYTLRIPITSSGEKVVKIFNSSSGTGAGKLFCYESILVETAVTHTLTNVTKSKGATKDTLGVVYNATYAASDGYTLPSTISVTIGGSAATAGTDYTWNSSTGAFQVPAAKVTGAIVVTITGEASGGGCSAPAAPTISGTTSYTVGQTITLTANCASGADASTTYTWYKGDTWGSKSQVQAAATGSSGYTFTKTAALGDAGTYWCEASNGTGCEAHNSTGKTITVSAPTYTLTASAAVINPMTEDSKTGAITGSFTNNPVSSIPSGTSTSTSTNTFTVNGTTVTAAATIAGTSEQCDECTYRFDSWENIPATVTANVSNIHAKYNTTYSITYNKNSGDWVGGYSAPAYYVYGTGATLPTDENIERDGYTFEGWTLSGESFDLSSAWGNVTLDANWTEDSGNTLTYNSNGGTGSMSNTTGTGSVTLRTNTYTKSGCSFAGWATSQANANAGTITYDDGDSYTLSADATLYAVWKVNTPAVSSSSISLNPEKTTTWFTIPSGATLYYTTNGNTPTSSSSLYDDEDGIDVTSSVTIKIIAIRANHISSDVLEVPFYQLHLYCNTGTCTPTAPYIMKDYAYSDMSASGSTGYSFSSWSTTSGSGSFGDASSSLTSYTMTSNGASIYATWVCTSPSFGTNLSTSPVNYAVDASASALTVAATANGGTVTYQWYSNDENNYDTPTELDEETGTSYTPSTADEGTTYYFCVATNTDGGDCTTNSNIAQIVVADTKYTLSYSDGSATSGSKSGGTAAGSYVEGTTITVPAQGTLAKSGYTFRGWHDGTTFYLAGQTFSMPASDVTLTAVWDELVSDCKTWSGSPNSFTNGSMTVSSNLILTSGSIDNPSGVAIYSGSGNVTCFVINGAAKYLEGHLNDGGDISSVTISAATNQSSAKIYAIVFSSSSDFSSTVTVYTHTAPSASADRNDANLIHEFTAPSGTKYFRVYRKFTYDATDYGDNQTIRVYGVEVCKAGGSYTNYTVTFADGNTAPASHLTWPDNIEGVPTGKKILAPSTTPTASGYIFGGWYTNAACSSAVNWSTMTITADKTIYAKWVAKTAPTQYTLSGDSYYCPSGTATLTLSGSQSGISYQLLKGGSASGDPKAGTGGELEWEVDAAGTYTVKAVENATYSERAMSGSVTVSAAATTDISTPPTTSVSATASVNFTLGSDMVTAGHGLEYQWYSYTTAGGAGEAAVDGAESATYTTSKSAGTYYYKVKVSGDCGDPVYSNMITVTVKIAPSVYTVSGTTSICSGETATITLADSEDGIEYQLLKGGVAEGDPVDGTGDALEWEVSAAGTYTVKTVETSTYAEATMSSSAVITVNAVTAFTTNLPTSTKYINANASYTYTIAASGTSLSYQWYTCNSDGTGKVAMSDKTTASMTYIFTNSDAPTKYVCCVVTGTCGTITSNVQPVNITPTYYLTINLNGGSEGGISSGNRPAGNFIIANSSTIPTKSGYVFLGWKFSTNNVIYQPGATVTMPSAAATLTAQWETACASITDAAKNGSWSNVASGGSITSDVLDGTITGATLKNSGSGTLSANDTRGLVLNNNSTLQLTIALTDGMFQAGTVIEIGGISNNSNSTAYGFLVSNMATSPATYTTTDAAYQNFKVRYVVTEDDGIEGTSSFTVKQANSNQVYFKSLTIGGCQSCTTISPTLTYSATTLYAFGGTPNTATPTLNKDGNTGAVTWSSSNTSVVTVDASGNITAVGAGSATITAELTYDGVRCGGIASCDITVPALVTQTLNVASETAWGTTPALTFTPSDKGMEQVLRLTKNTFTFDSTSTSTKQDGTSKRWMTASFTGSETTKGKYLKMAFKNTQHNLRLGEVVVPIQPISNNGSAQVEIYEGSTLRMTSTAVTGITKGSLADVHFTFASPYVFAAGSTINVYIYFYGQTTGFRLASPILISGAVLTDYTYTTSGNWSTAANWNWGKLPMAGDNVVLQKPVTVDNTSAVAKNVVIDKSGGNTGKLTIAADGMLIAAGTIRANGDAQTAVEDVVINTTKTSQGALIFDNPSGSKQTKGTVNFYTKSSRIDGKLQWQYVGLPFTIATDEIYGGLYVNKYSEADGGWIIMRNQGDRTIYAWEGLAISGDDAGYACMQGTFVPTGTKTISLTYNNHGGKGKNLIGNSWTAPIQIAEMEESDFGGARATVYIFNTGRYNPAESEGSVDGSGTDNKTAGVWVTIPIEAAKTAMAAETWGSLKVIPAYQGFQVKTAATSAKTLTLDYDKHVRPATNTTNEALRAPIRRTADDVKFMRLSIESNKAKQTVYLFESNRFSDDFDNGWDGDYMGISGQDAYLYIVSPTLGKLAVSAQNDLEGSILGVQSGAQDEYVFTFAGDGMGYYLNDLKTQESTLIEEGNTYTFTYEKGDAANRFMISATPFAKTNPTGVDKVQGDKVQSDKVRKVLIDDHLYIIRAGKMFNATGGRVR